MIALDTFNEPHLQLPDVDEAVTISFPPEACFVLGAARDGALASCGGRRGGVTVRLDGIDLVVFDKDGTIIEFGSMWSGWAVALVEGLTAATGRPIAAPLYAMLGVDPATGTVLPGGGLAATPMARLRDRTREVLVASGMSEADAERALEAAWHAPDPVASARPVTDLRALFDRLRAGGCRIAVATTDDRDPTERTAGGPGPRGPHRRARSVPTTASPSSPRRTWSSTCAPTLGIEPARTAVVGDTVADLSMGRAAGAGLIVGRAHRRRRTHRPGAPRGRGDRLGRGTRGRSGDLDGWAKSGRRAGRPELGTAAGLCWGDARTTCAKGRVMGDEACRCSVCARPDGACKRRRAEPIDLGWLSVGRRRGALSRVLHLSSARTRPRMSSTTPRR